MLHDRVDRLAGLAVQHVDVAGLAQRRDALDRASVHHHVEQDGPRRQVPVPDVVVQRLEVPLQLAGLDVDAEHGVGEQVHAEPRRGVVVGRRVGGVDVDHAQLFVDRGGQPDPAAVTLLPAPGVLRDLPARVAGPLRHRVEHPAHLAGHGVHRGQQASRQQSFGERQADEQQAPRRGRRIGHREPHGGGVDVGRVGVGILEGERGAGHLQVAAVAERLDQLAGLGIDGVHDLRSEGVDPAVRVRRTASAAGKRRIRLERPDRIARRRVERGQHRAGVEVHDAVDHERGGGAHELARRRLVTPLELQVADVGRVDPVRRREAGVAHVQVVQRPVDAGGRVDTRRRPGVRRPPAFLSRGWRRQPGGEHGRQAEPDSRQPQRFRSGQCHPLLSFCHEATREVAFTPIRPGGGRGRWRRGGRSCGPPSASRLPGTPRRGRPAPPGRRRTRTRPGS